MISGIDPLTATAADLQTKLTDKAITSKQLVKLYLDQITRYNGYLKAVIATAPQGTLEKAAAELDDERAGGRIRGPLHGIPILVKDNIATAPKLGLPTTCGSLALVGSKPRKNATIIERLIAAGAIILGKANLSEWAWYRFVRLGNIRDLAYDVRRSDFANSGWSAVGGQTQSAYVRGGFRPDDSNGGHSNPGGSSSGSAVAIAAGFSPIAIGTDTTGSIIMPSDRSALYGMKPTWKIVPQEGIIATTFEADSAGPMTKSVLDLAHLLDVLVDPSKTVVPKGGYKSAVTGKWGEIRIGVVKPEEWLFPTKIVKYEQEASEQMLREWKSAYEHLRGLVKIVKPVSLLSLDEASDNGSKNIWNAFDSTFQSLLESYLQSIDGCKIKTLRELIKFNEDHAEQELHAGANNQAGFLRALHAHMSEDEYQELINYARDRCGRRGIDKVLEENGVDIIMGPGDGPMMNIPSTAGYPSATLPLGYLDFNGRAFGLQITTKAHQEALLIQAQSAWEATFPRRQPPPLDEIVGTR